MESVKNIYTFNGEDVTLDILFKVERVVSVIAEREKCGFDGAYSDFLASKTYRAMKNPRSLLWAENAEFIVDEYYREQENSPQ